MPSESSEQQKIGTGVLKAFGRLGLAEARTALNPFQSSPIVQPTDYGMWGVATPGEVADARRGEAKEKEDEPLLAYAGVGREGPERDDRDIDRD